MRKIAASMLTAAALLAWVALPLRPAAADDETADTEIKIVAPLDAVDCTSTPQTISVLGLTIDITNAAIGSGDESGDNSGGDQSGGTTGGDQSDDDGGSSGGGTPAGCAGLVVGTSVEVKLSSDAAPLVAAEVGQGDGGEVKIEGPIQSVDTTANTVTVLGLVVDVSQANTEGADDDSSDGNGQAIDLSQLVAGQIVEMKLASNQPPLAATELQVKNFANQVDVEVDDSTGQEVDDTDSSGTPEDDVDVTVDETVKVQNPAATAGAAAPRRIKRTIHVSTQKNGSFTLAGLPTGHAKITVTRTRDGVTTLAHRSVAVKANTMKHVRVHLHKTK